MKYSLEISTGAEIDLQEAWEWYESERSGLGDELLDEITEFLERIEINPERYGYAKEPIRKVALNTFPYLIYYEVLEKTIFVHAIHHSSRAPRLYTPRR